MSRDIIDRFRRFFEEDQGAYEPESIREPGLEEKKNELQRGDYSSREIVVRKLYPSGEYSKDSMYREVMTQGVDITYNAFERNIKHLTWKDILEEEEGFYSLTEEGKEAAEDIWDDLG